MHTDSFNKGLYDANFFDLSDRLLLEDDDLIVLNKPPVVPVVPDKTGDSSLLDVVEEYCGHPLKVVHRIDRPCSGIVIFAKNKQSSIILSKQFKERSLVKKYYAVVAKTKKLPPYKQLEDKLYHDGKRNKSFIRSWIEEGGKIAKMEYELIDTIKKYALLEVDIQTGRHHQIRAQLAHFGYPIKGDVKYGFKRGNRDRSIQLHAWKISFLHPSLDEEITIKVNPPIVDVWKYFDYSLHDIV